MRDQRFHETHPATALLLLINIAFFLLEVIQTYKITGAVPQPLQGGGIPPAVTELLGSLKPVDIERGEYWRLVAATFVHGDFLHILFNGLILFDLGFFCEPLLSHWKFLVAYFVSAMGGWAGSLLYKWYFLGTAGPWISSVGASGAICGLLGLLVVYSIRERQVELRDRLIRNVAGIVVITFLMSRVDHAGHLGGFLAGGAFGLTVSDYISSRAAARWRYPGYATALLVAGSLAFALWNFFARR